MLLIKFKYIFYFKYTTMILIKNNVNQVGHSKRLVRLSPSDALKAAEQYYYYVGFWYC